MNITGMIALGTVMAVGGKSTWSVECVDRAGFAIDAKETEETPGLKIVTLHLKSAKATLPPKFRFRFDSPVSGVAHVWTSEWQRDSFHLWPASWEHKWKMSSELAKDVPIAVGFGSDGHSRLAVATSEAFEKVDFGMAVAETNGWMTGCFDFFTRPTAAVSEYSCKVRLDERRCELGSAVTAANEWIAAERNLVPAAVPEAAYDPLYSTWYSFWQDVRAGQLEHEAVLAAKLGMKTMILDDGWQKVESRTDYSACGDWQPVPSRFPDMKAHVAAVHKAGLKYMLWISVPYVGEESKAYSRFGGKFLKDAAEPGVKVVDPRFPEVREYLISTFERAVRDWGFDGLKLDFIDEFALAGEDPAVAENYAGRDIRGVPEAVDTLMKETLRRLKAINPEVLIEFRQGYMGPAIRQYGNMIRALDCPVDPFNNRRRIANLRMTSGSMAVHSDMLAWSRSETPEGAALSILNAMFGVVQYSMVLDTVREDHAKVIRHWIDFSQKHRGALLKGSFRARNPEAGFPVLEGENDKERIVAVYEEDRVITVNPEKPAIVINATKSETLVIEVPDGISWHTFDTFGCKMNVGRTASGISRFHVPASGFISFESRSRSGNGSNTRGSSDGSRLVAGDGYEISSAWEPIPIMGRTFYSIMGYQSLPLMKAHPEFPMYEHPWLEIQGPFYQNDLGNMTDPVDPKKAWTNFPSRISEVLAQPGWKTRMEALDFFERNYPDHPFTIAFWGSRPIKILKDTPFDTDRGDFAKWLKAHPGFFSFCAFDEYDSDVGGYLWQIIETVKDPALKARYGRQYTGEGRDRLRNWASHDFGKSKSYHFGSDRLYGLWANWPSVGHLLASGGLKLLWYEAEHGSTASPWTWGGIFSRGAARQFATTFGWYCASFTYNTCSRDGRTPKEMGVTEADMIPKWPNPNEKNPKIHFGGSRSLMRRNLWYGYLIGSVWHCMEGSGNFFYAADEKGGWTLSPYGEDYNRIFAWNKNHDRGIVYTPVALLTSCDELFSRNQYYDYGSFAKKDPSSPAAFAFTLTPAYVPASLKHIFAQAKEGLEGCMWNSEFGEIADVLCPDIGTPNDRFEEVLKGYKAAFLVGEHDRSRCNTAVIERYVSEGGTLFCSCDQVTDGFVSESAAGLKPLAEIVKGSGEYAGYEFHKGAVTTAKPYLKDENDNVIAWVNDCGKGRVVTVAAVRMIDADLYPVKINVNSRNPLSEWANGAKGYPSIITGERKFPIIRKLLKRVQDETMPIRVCGDIQWGLNKVRSKQEEGRREDGWLLWLINNNGVKKFAGEPEELDLSKTSSVTVDITRCLPRSERASRPAFSKPKVFDVTDPDPAKAVELEVKNGTFTVSVKPGEDRRISTRFDCLSAGRSTVGAW